MNGLPVVPLASLALFEGAPAPDYYLAASFLLESLLVGPFGANNKTSVIEVILGGKENLLFYLSLIVQDIETPFNMAFVVVACLLSPDDWNGLRLAALL